MTASHATASAILRDRRFSSSPAHARGYQPPAYPPGDPRAGQPDSDLLTLDPPDHTRLRRLVSGAFTPKAVADLEPLIRDTAGRLLDAAGDGGFDLIEALAFPLPIAVICHLLGVPEQDRDQFRAWGHDVAASLDPQPARAAANQSRLAEQALAAYLRDLVARRRAEPDGSLLSALVAVEEEGDRLTPGELVSMALLLLVAGFETTVNLIGNGTFALLSEPGREQWRMLGDDPSLVPGAVEELLRYDSPVQMTSRIATEDTDVGGTVIRRGTPVIVAIGGANRDPDGVHRPRPPAGHPAGRVQAPVVLARHPPLPRRAAGPPRGPRRAGGAHPAAPGAAAGRDPGPEAVHRAARLRERPRPRRAPGRLAPRTGPVRGWPLRLAPCGGPVRLAPCGWRCAAAIVRAGPRAARPSWRPAPSPSAAGEEHRFTAATGDFTVLVVFGPAEERAPEAAPGPLRGPGPRRQSGPGYPRAADGRLPALPGAAGHCAQGAAPARYAGWPARRWPGALTGSGAVMTEFAYTEALRVLCGDASADLGGLLATTCAAACDPVVYLADYSRQVLFPLAAGAPAEPVEGTMAGRAFTTGEPAVSAGDGPARVWVPVVEQAARSGVLAVSLPDTSEGSVREAELLGVFAGLALSAMNRFTDAPRVRRHGRALSLPASMQWDLLPPWAIRMPGATIAGILEGLRRGRGRLRLRGDGEDLHFAVVDGMGHGLGATMLPACQSAPTGTPAAPACRSRRCTPPSTRP